MSIVITCRNRPNLRLITSVQVDEGERDLGTLREGVQEVNI